MMCSMCITTWPKKNKRRKFKVNIKPGFAGFFICKGLFLFFRKGTTPARLAALENVKTGSFSLHGRFGTCSQAGVLLRFYKIG